ncbi:hypothetical protein BC941DRAFT_430593 [Chlamydoabsidia padenii]|nr:hypothetical protein BC941DRAFT_430593 [Chlamydoabsidia padenii]
MRTARFPLAQLLQSDHIPLIKVKSHQHPQRTDSIGMCGENWNISSLDNHHTTKTLTFTNILLTLEPRRI